MGTDVGLNLAASATATSGGQINNSKGDRYSGGGLPKWFLPMAIVSMFVLAVLFILRK